MKVALCLSGLPRLFKKSTESWQTFIKKYNADVFIHSWGDDTTKKAIINAYSPKLLVVEPAKSFDVSLYTDRIWPHRSSPMNVISSWYSINQVLNLSERYYTHTGEDYDVILRSRFDWWCDDIELEINEGLTVPDDPGLSGHHFNFMGPRLAHNDQAGYGNKTVMKKYASTYHEIPRLYLNGIDFCSELFLTANMIDKNIRVNFQTLKYGIIRE